MQQLRGLGGATAGVGWGGCRGGGSEFWSGVRMRGLKSGAWTGTRSLGLGFEVLDWDSGSWFNIWGSWFLLLDAWIELDA